MKWTKDELRSMFNTAQGGIAKSRFLGVIRDEEAGVWAVRYPYDNRAIALLRELDEPQGYPPPYNFAILKSENAELLVDLIHEKRGIKPVYIV